MATMPPVRRGAAVLAMMVAVALSATAGLSFASRVSTSTVAAKAAAVDRITLRGRKGVSGPWRTYLFLKLKRGGIPVSFSVCALLGSRHVPPACHAAAGAKLPAGARMRLEQRRSGQRAWKMVGLSFMPYLDARLSNDVGGNRFGTVHYRVTLRGPNGKILRTSNPFRVIWRR